MARLTPWLGDMARESKPPRGPNAALGLISSLVTPDLGIPAGVGMSPGGEPQPSLGSVPFPAETSQILVSREEPLLQLKMLLHVQTENQTKCPSSGETFPAPRSLGCPGAMLGASPATAGPSAGSKSRGSVGG